jgi:hypothetical protein
MQRHGNGTHDVSSASLSRLGVLTRLLGVAGGGPDQACHRFENSSHVTLAIGSRGGKETLSGFEGEVGFLDFAFSRVLWVLGEK